MNNLTVELNGIRYVLIDDFVTDEGYKKTKRLVIKHECIFQGIKKISRGFIFWKSYAIITLLVPEKNIIAFNNENN